MLPVDGLYGHIQRNNLKSAVLFAGFIALLEALQLAGFLFAAIVNAGKPWRHAEGVTFDTVMAELFATGGFFDTGWLYTLLIALVWVAAGCTWHAHIVRFETRSRRVGRREEPALHNLVENLAIAAGLPMPRIEVIESEAMNAFAAGFAPRFATITVTRGLLRSLTRDEVEAVIAHELTHVKYRDVRLMTVARTCMSLVAPLGQMIWDGARERPFVAAGFALWLALFTSPLVAVIAVAVALAVMAAAFAVRGTIARAREFVADAGAIELTRNPDALIQALTRIAGRDRLSHVGSATQAMMFSSETLGWLAAHPPVAERIAAIRRHAATLVLSSRTAIERQAVRRIVRAAGERTGFGDEPAVAYRGASAASSAAWTAHRPATAHHPAEPVGEEERPGRLVDWMLSGRADRQVKQAGRTVMYVAMAPLLLPLIVGVLVGLPAMLLFVVVRLAGG